MNKKRINQLQLSLKNKKALLLVGILAVFLILGGLFAGNRLFLSSKTHHITLTSDGFQPTTLTIKKGDSVQFTTTAGEQFWPASDLHPSHTIYSEFDPKQPIEPNESWTFQFTREGEWAYHDHLNPLFRGTITVGAKEAKVSSVNPDKCKNNQPGFPKQKCFGDLMDQTLQTEGLDQAFKLMEYLYQTEPDYASSCHDYAHKLGQKGYELFSTNQNLPLSQRTSYCGYGFYHGFLETLIQKTGNTDQAKEFCAYAGRTLKETTSDAEGACYHGIGHGVVDGSDPRNWGNPQAMIQPGLTMCEKVSGDKDKLFRCVTGVYNALEILMSSNQYKLSLDLKDPFSICRTQIPAYQEACYTQLLVGAMNAASGDMDKTAQYISTIPEDQYAIPTMQGLVVERVRLGKTDFDDTIAFCQKLPSRFQLPCIPAFGEGFLKYGPPQNEYKQAIAFCSYDKLSEQQKSSCFNRVLSILRIWYTTTKATEICKSVAPKYQFNNCQYH